MHDFTNWETLSNATILANLGLVSDSCSSIDVVQGDKRGFLAWAVLALRLSVGSLFIPPLGFAGLEQVHDQAPKKVVP